MDPFLIVLTVILCVFAVVVLVVGIQLVLVLQEIKLTLRKVNVLSETLEKATHQVMGPLHSLGGTVEGMKSGLKVAQAFMSWLNKDSKHKDD